MSQFRKVIHFLSSVLFYSIMALLVVVVFMFFAYFIDQKIGMKQGQKRQPLFGAYIIMSNSMVPSINVRDAVVTMRVSQNKIEMNDIITFISKNIETNGTPITHRVIGIVETESGIKYRTKGDHNNTADFALISPDEVIGKVYLKIPMIGYIQYFLTKPIGWLLIIVIPCLFIIGGDVLKLFKSTKQQPNNINIENEQTTIVNNNSNNNIVNNIDNSQSVVINNNNIYNQNNNYYQTDNTSNINSQQSDTQNQDDNDIL